jgi:hypothetical protein
MIEKFEFALRPAAEPKIYAYEDSNPKYRGLLKIGYTTIDVERRVGQQYPTLHPLGKPYRIVFAESAMYEDGTSFIDHDVHKALRKKGFEQLEGEWFRCTAIDVRAAWIAVRSRTDNAEERTQTFGMRPEQIEAVEQTMAYFKVVQAENGLRSPKFLWNAKMRFGKTFATYQLAKKMGFKRLLILTFKPAVESAWQEDLMTHVDFEGWQFVTREGLQYEDCDLSRPIVCFGSFQDYMGVDRNTGRIKGRNEWVHTTQWDMVAFDEYHFGAWTDNAKKLFEEQDDDQYDTIDMDTFDRGNAYNETWLPITATFYLYLSGTPFRALGCGEFIEEQIYNWTYADEQRAKLNWVGVDSPYAALPRMVMLTYKIPDTIRHIAMQGEFDEFDLNVFFLAEGQGKLARFVYESYVQKWLDLIRGAFLPTGMDDLKLGAEKPPMPYSDTRLLSVLTHTFWFLPNVASCYAMRNLLLQGQNTFYHDYKINVCAGAQAGIGLQALPPVLKSMGDPLKTKTITLSCGKLTTGVTVRPWTGIFMLRNLSSPETYFQAAFRVQNPWTIDTGAGHMQIMKEECYIFDFALDRALRQISDYSRNLDKSTGNPEKKVSEFISFLPVLAYDGSSMRQISAADILDITMAGTSATLLAKRWESALLVNVDNETLARLMANDAAMKALMSIEGFRSLNAEIQTIINKSNAVKKVKKENGGQLTPKEKRELSDDEKEYKSKRKKIQEKLIKFATRIPIFMYLTDYREYSLEDVIKQLEPSLFKTVTGLTVQDFDLLCSLGLFNKPLMNDAVYKFRRYEDSSLSYTGLNRHEGEGIGLFDTVMAYQDYMNTMRKQQLESLTAPPRDESDIPSNPFSFIIPDDERDDDDDEVPAVTIPFAKRGPTNTRMPIVKKPTVSQPIGQPRIVHGPALSSSTTPQPESNPYNNPEKQMIDITKVKVGAYLTHKAFGRGRVVSLDATMVCVSFKGVKRNFQFPNAIYQGFLVTDGNMT